MNDDLKKRIQKAKSLGYTDDQINATIQAHNQQQGQRQQPQQSRAMNTNQTVEQPKQNDGFIKGVAKTLIKPAVDFGKLVAGTGFEVARAADSAMGNKNAYDVQKGAKNPFITREEFEKDYSTPTDILKQTTKKTAAAGSYFVPGGAGVTGAIKTGAVAGGLYGFGESEADDLEGMAVDTAVGAGTGAAIGGVFGIGGKVLGKMRGAKNAADKAIVNPQMAASPTTPAKQQKLIDELGKMGINKGTAAERYAKVNQVYNDLTGQAKTILQNSKQTRVAGRMNSVVKQNIIDNGEYFIPNDTRHAAILDRELKLLSKKAEGKLGKLTAQDLFDFKIELGNKLKNAFKKESGDLASPVSDLEGVRLDLWRNLDDIITKLEPGVKDITGKMSFLHKASSGLQKSAEKMAELKPMGIPTGINMSGVQQQIMDKGSRAVSSIGNATAMIPQGVTEIGGRTAIMSATDKLTSPPTEDPVNIEAESINTDQTQEQQGDVQFVSPDNQWYMSTDGRAYSMDKQWMWDDTAGDWIANEQANAIDWTDENAVLMLMQQDLEATGGKNITEIKSMYEIASKGKDGSTGKSLPVTAQTQVNLAKSGSRGLEEAMKLYKEDPSVLTKQLIPGQWQSRRFDSAMFKTVEALLRARSGAAVPEQEVRRYLTKYGATFGDDPETVQFKFDQLKQDFADVFEGAYNTSPGLDISQATQYGY